ncbi:MAG: 2,3-cyclic 3-phosphodiesterase [Thermoplasmata archaeon]|jgi:2'-5' RNA ligase|nr:2,3-cyclic 3-phosphodiesterase [Thermoplasmata archaeon]
MAFRAFVAVPLPRAPESEALLASLARTGADLKMAPESQHHLTLSFLGDVAEDQAARMGALLDEAARGIAPFDLPLHGVGAFPNPRAPRVIWLGSMPCPPLETLAARVRERLPPDDAKPFAAHVTLARVQERGRVGALPQWLAEHAAFEHPPARVHAVRLYRSTLARGGALHDVLHESPLEA